MFIVMLFNSLLLLFYSPQTTSPNEPVIEETVSAEQVLRDEVNFIKDVSRFYNQEMLSDISLKVGDVAYFGHKFILAKSSDVFRTMLYEKNWSQGVKTEMELDETEECRKVFDKFLRYLYAAEVSISDATAVGILCLADKYNVTSLKDLCTAYMSTNSQSPHLANALNWYPWAKLLNLSALLRRCTATISWNYGSVIVSDNWVNIDIEFILDFLKSSELIISNEFALWEAVQTWLLHDCRKDNLRENVSQILPLIRFPQMLVPQLFQLERSEIATNAECKDVLQQLLSRAHRFRFHIVLVNFAIYNIHVQKPPHDWIIIYIFFNLLICEVQKKNCIIVLFNNLLFIVTSQCFLKNICLQIQ